MRLRRLTITLPAHLKATGEHDARAIAEAVGRALHEAGEAAPTRIELNARGQNGATLAMQAGAAFGGKPGGGHGR